MTEDRIGSGFDGIFTSDLQVDHLNAPDFTGFNTNATISSIGK